MTLKAKIYNCPDKCISGSELKRLRRAAGLTQQELADKLTIWGWYKLKITHLEAQDKICLHPDEMKALLDALGAKIFFKS